jgi:hypothetical protein
MTGGAPAAAKQGLIIMKMFGLGKAAFAAVALFAASAQADVLYNNGSSSYDFDAWVLANGLKVSNSFTLANAALIDEFSFDTWNYPVDSIVLKVAWSISSTPFGTTLGGGTNNTSQVSTLLFDNGKGYKIERNLVPIGPLYLTAGTYWLNLGTATTNDGQIAYWDINHGPSHAVHSTLGDLSNAGCISYFGLDKSCSSTFTIRGIERDAAVPEPASWALMITGFGLVGTVLRRRATLATA